MNAVNEFGSIKEGLKADLILLNSNPLEDVKNAQERVGVMVRGKWFEESVMKQLVDERFGIPDIIEEEDILTNSDYNLSQNYPNPFNQITTIKYSIPKQSKITLKVFDILGIEVATLVNKEQSQGHYEIEFNGSELTSGIYLYRLRVSDFIKTKKMIILK